MRLWQVARRGFSLEEISSLSSLPYLEGGRVYFPCQLHVDRHYPFGGRGSIPHVYESKSLCSADFDLFNRVNTQLRVERGDYGSLFIGRNHFWRVRGGIVRECGHGVRRALEKYKTMET